jgi:uncharacterized protein YbaR (Trm112 family)
VFIELVDLLRCPRPHEDTWLVAAIHERADRDIVRGVLGCPICKASYQIRDRIAIFDETAPSRPADERSAYDESDDDMAMRCAAMLNLFDSGGAVLLAGAWARAAHALRDITPVSVLVVDAPGGLPLGNGVSALRIGDSLPVAAGALRGVALDDGRISPALMGSVARALRAGGRLIAPNSADVPRDITERARDDRHWVGEAQGPASAPVRLTRQRTPLG